MRRGLLVALTTIAFTAIASVSAIGAGAGAGAAGPAGTQNRLPTVLGNWVKGRTRLLVRPAQIIYTGDGSGVLGGFDGGNGTGFGHIRWNHWSTGSAYGHGANWIDDCTPDCADGTYTAHAATVNAFRPRGGRFTRLTIKSTYRGKPLNDRFKLVRAQGELFYTFVH